MASSESLLLTNSGSGSSTYSCPVPGQRAFFCFFHLKYIFTSDLNVVVFVAFFQGLWSFQPTEWGQGWHWRFQCSPWLAFMFHRPFPSSPAPQCLSHFCLQVSLWSWRASCKWLTFPSYQQPPNKLHFLLVAHNQPLSIFSHCGWSLSDVFQPQWRKCWLAVSLHRGLFFLQFRVRWVTSNGFKKVVKVQVF